MHSVFLVLFLSISIPLRRNIKFNLCPNSRKKIQRFSNERNETRIGKNHITKFLHTHGIISNAKQNTQKKQCKFYGNGAFISSKQSPFIFVFLFSFFHSHDALNLFHLHNFYRVVCSLTFIHAMIAMTMCVHLCDSESEIFLSLRHFHMKPTCAHLLLSLY